MRNFTLKKCPKKAKKGRFYPILAHFLQFLLATFSSQKWAKSGQMARKKWPKRKWPKIKCLWPLFKKSKVASKMPKISNLSTHNTPQVL